MKGSLRVIGFSQSPDYYTGLLFCSASVERDFTEGVAAELR